MNGYQQQPYGQVDLPMPQPQFLNNEPALEAKSAAELMFYDALTYTLANTVQNRNFVVRNGTRLFYYGGITAAAYHGYRRNKSGLWALAWAAFAAMLPIVAPGVALAQGFGKPKRKNGRR